MERIFRTRVLRTLAVVFVLVLFGTACSNAEDELRAEMRADGLSDDSIDCVFDGLDEAGIDVAELESTDAPSEEAAMALSRCMEDLLGDLFAEGFEQLGEDMAEAFEDLDMSEGSDGPLAFTEDLGALSDACRAGDNAACDELWISSPFGSEEEKLAEACGGRSNEPRMGSCEFWLD